MSIPKKFTREEWDFGYLEKKDAMRVLGLGKSSLDNYQKEHEIKKGYKKRNGNDSIAVYRLRDVYHLAIQKKGEWVGIERPLVMEASLDTDAEYKSTKSKSDIVETKNENLALPEELITLLIKNGMNDAMKDYMKEHSMEVKPSLSKKKRLSLFAVGGVVISALIVVPVWILSDTFETFHKDSVTQLSNEYGKLIEANGEAHAKEKTSLKKEAVQNERRSKLRLNDITSKHKLQVKQKDQEIQNLKNIIYFEKKIEELKNEHLKTSEEEGCLGE